jgi:hypothetical protein
MFDTRDSENELSTKHQLAHVVALLSLPPVEFV